ncbi:clavesin-1 [Eurosta solidaginis]|uniref:clavesin-1 n=1 Tax=Eurosta solidaginis TaxID=178769 RepID=UPI0035307F6A
MRPLPPKLAEIAREALNETPERIKQDLIILRTWIYQQRYLNARTSTDFLISQLRRCKYSLEETKKRIDDFFIFITKCPEITAKRRVSEKILAVNRMGLQYFPECPSFNDQSAIMITRFGGCCAKSYHIRDILAYNTMAMELIALENDNAAVVGVSEILDLSNMNIEHTSQLSADGFRFWCHWVNNCSPLRTNAVYCLNPPKELLNLLAVYKRLCLRKEMFPPWIVVRSLEELYQYIPQDCLPEEYGGKNGHIRECIEYMDELLKSYRNYFDDEKNYGTIEELRHGDGRPYETEFGADGSFRKLFID